MLWIAASNVGPEASAIRRKRIRPILGSILRRDQNQHLSCRSAAAFSGLRTTQKSLIDFHGSCQAIPTWTHHGATQLVQPSPRRVVTAQSQQTLQPQRIHPLLLVGHVPHRLKPKPQRFPRILEDGAGRERSFQVTLRTAEKPALHRPRPSISAARATKPFGPAKLKQILPAAVLSSERILKLLHRSRVLLHTGRHYIQQQRESSAYPNSVI